MPLQNAKRGRPRKVIFETIKNIEPKRKRGRPRKYPLNADISKVPKKRGRPKKIRPEFVEEKQEVKPLFPMKIGKALGYCPSCNTAISSLDIIKNINPKDIRPDIYCCYHCNKEIKKNNLLDSKPNKNEEYKYRTKKEYLEDCLKIPEDSHIPMNPVNVIIKEDLGEAVSPPNILEGEQ